MKRFATKYGLDFISPQVMTIVNVTPDSFYSGSRTFDEESICERVCRAVADGCSIIDIGGCSSRPDAEEVPAGEEIRRVELGLRCIRAVSKEIPVSVDTYRASVVRRAAELDDRIIVNDISAGELDAAMLPTVAEADVPYIAMHMRGTPATMKNMTDYADVVSEVAGYFRRKIDELSQCGVRDENIMLDPGFGFAKTAEQNYELLGRLHELCALGYPMVVGLSRKSMIYKVLGATPAESLAGTTALNWEALRQGASVLRVHDTREAADTIRIFNYFQKYGRQ